MSQAGSCFPAPWMVPLKAALNHGGTKRPKRDRKEARRKHIQLATINHTTGFPAVRTVAFHGFLLDTNKQETSILTLISDSRAEKVRHIVNGSSLVECCWWLDEAGVQFRIAGHAVVASVTSEHEQLRSICHEVWGRLSKKTQATFVWPDPGAPVAQSKSDAQCSEYCSDVQNDGDVDIFRSSPIEEDTREDQESLPLTSANFVVLLILPTQVDELHLGGQQRRTMYRSQSLDGGNDFPQGCSELLAKYLDAEQIRWQPEAVNP